MNRVVEGAKSTKDSYARTEGMLRAIAMWLGVGAVLAAVAAFVVPPDAARLLGAAAVGLGLTAAFYVAQARRWRTND